MAELTLLEKLQVVEWWLNEQIELSQSLLPHNSPAIKSIVMTVIHNDINTLQMRLGIVRSQLEVLNDYETHEAIKRQEER